MIQRILQAWQTPKLQLTAVDEFYMALPVVLLLVVGGVLFGLWDYLKGVRKKKAAGK